MFDNDNSMPNYERPSDKTILFQVSGFGTFLNMVTTRANKNYCIQSGHKSALKTWSTAYPAFAKGSGAIYSLSTSETQA
jgi:hypothetical protein